MFTLTLTSSRLRRGLLIFTVAILICLAAVILPAQKEIPVSGGIQPDSSASSLSERLAFLKSHGWDCDEQSEVCRKITIPNRFDSVYSEYNELQKAQGFDLTEYHGKNISIFSYRITNYPGYGAESMCIHATLMVYENLIIGGDISSTELTGFMHGFEYENAQ